MSSRRGTIALMGSGELTSTMVEVHKQLLAALGASRKAVFIDTPAGFQLNADDLARRAIRYFRDRVGHPMRIASLKSRGALSTYEAERTYAILRDADYILIGPGSPTYAVSQWSGTPVPEILMQRIQNGACLVAASAASLTVGHSTLPVYEIYKVGQDLHWVEGLRILDHFGFSLVVIPHWNNAEGGTHDTRFCYMGEPRFMKLESLLPSDVSILGLDEHTACIMDLETGEATVRGIGRVTLRRYGQEVQFEHGTRFSLDLLRETAQNRHWQEKDQAMPVKPQEVVKEDDSFWSQIQAAEAVFEEGAEGGRLQSMVTSLLDLDRIIWKGQQELEDPEFIAQARELFRELIVRMGSIVDMLMVGGSKGLAPLVEALVRLRERYRLEKRWHDADLLRQCLNEAGIVVEDTAEGARWKLQDEDAQRMK